MSRIKLNTIIKNQLPDYIRNEYPLIGEFLSQYYLAQEYQGAPIDLIQNIDKYIKLDNHTNTINSIILGSDIDTIEETLVIDATKSPKGTYGFPNSYGLLKIDNEVITYTGKTDFSFTGCLRGFSGVTSYTKDLKPKELLFESTEASEHTSGSTIQNLSCLFLNKFLQKSKVQLIPGLEDRQLSEELNENTFIKHAKDYYLSRGTDRGFEVIFKALYNEDVEIIKPSVYLSTPSNSNYKILNSMVVEPIFGDPLELTNRTLYQGYYNTNINNAHAPVVSVEGINVGTSKTYYKLGFDGGYNRDIGTKGTIYGDFSIHPKTQVIGQVSVGSSTINVDSTVGFESLGELFVTYTNGNIGIVSYTSKSLNQFFDCTNITEIIKDKSVVGINTFAYAVYTDTDGEDNIIEVRINSVLKELVFYDDTEYYKKGDVAKIKTLGISDSSFKAKNWFYNISPIYKIKNISVIDSLDNTYRLDFNIDHHFKSGDSAIIISNIEGEKTTNIISVPSSTAVIIRGQGYLDITNVYNIKRTLLNAKSDFFENSSIYTTNVQNVYKSKTDSNKYLIASSSIPSYESQNIETDNRSVKFSGTFIGEEFSIVTDGSDHGFYTGDSVYYMPQKLVTNSMSDDGKSTTSTSILSSLFDDDTGGEGLYFITRISESNIKLSRSRTNVYNKIYVSLSSNTTITDNIIIPYGIQSKKLQSQKILRELSNPNNDGLSTNVTNPGATGILINGVEILNYKSADSIKYGSIENIDVVSSGFDFDIINPPSLKIIDDIGIGATGFVAVSGSLKEIRIIDPGYDYQDNPVISITGGNGINAKAYPNMRFIDYSISFNSNNTNIGLGTTLSTIGFGTYHKLKNSEEVVYNTDGQKGISGITTETHYFVFVQDNETIKLHNTSLDSISGINTVTLLDFGSGIHSFKSISKKSVIDSINIVSSGSGYENKKRTCQPVGVNTALNTINIKNHDYNSGEIIKYESDITSIDGITSGVEYYVTKIDDDNFKLSNINSGVSTYKDLFYKEKEYINFTSSGIGTHSFNYPDIEVNISGKIGISSIGSETFEAKIQPIFRGEISSVHLSNNGVGYGSSEVINFEKEPKVELISGINAQVTPVIRNQSISEVIVNNQGKNYISIPDLEIGGNGSGAVLTPIIENGKLISIKVIHGGIGYSNINTSINVISPGQDYKLKPILNKWNINLVEKYFSQIKNDDGYIKGGRYGLQYYHLYSPRKLRELIFSNDQDGKVLYGQHDLRLVDSLEVNSSNHSPIIGWAYDGNPIYGPYGYSKNNGGVVVQMTSGYKIDIKSSRPPLSMFPEGFFIEDYTYYKVDDEDVLDKNNGRFCITPEFPNGTYAYFSTLDDSGVESSGPFVKYKKPVFPYLIGENYYSNPIDFNFNDSSNQDDIDLYNSTWCRNTEPYNLIEDNNNYEYVTIPNKLSQTIDIDSVSVGGISTIGISSSGDLYKVNDTIEFTTGSLYGNNAIAKITKVFGKSVSNISVASTSIAFEIYPSNIIGEYVLTSENPHNIQDLDNINLSGLSTSIVSLEGSYVAGISQNIITTTGIGTISSGILTSGITGIVTYFNVSGDLNSNNIRENDILGIGTERVKVLNIEPELSRIRVLREVDSTIGSAHTVTSLLTEDSRKVKIKTNIKDSFTYKYNKEIYFNPTDSIGIGTVGIGGSVITFSNPGTGHTQLSLPLRTIYIKNHNLNTGDLVTYNSNGGSKISYVEYNDLDTIKTFDNNQNVYIAKINQDLIGISTVKVGLGTAGGFVGINSSFKDSEIVYFTGIGTGTYHSFTTNYDKITSNLDRHLVTVSTTLPHQLNSNDNVNIDVNPSISTSIIVKYNDYNRRIVINPISFISSAINITTNSINIQNHKFSTGDKVIYTSDTPSGGLENNNIYYIIKVDNNNIKLSNTRYNSSILSNINITSAQNGTINPINPPIIGYKDSIITFDLSDSSLSYTNLSTLYSAFDFNLYFDKNFTKVWNKTDESTIFKIEKNGSIGISTDANVKLIVNNYLPQTLYYRLDPIFKSDIPSEKENIIIDTDIISGSELQILESFYNGNHSITNISDTEFTYTTNNIPENSQYTSIDSTIIYDTKSTSVSGPIKDITLINSGGGYKVLPGIRDINSVEGNSAILNSMSSTIGSIVKSKINDIGYDFPFDTTLQPTVSLPQIIRISRLNSIESIGISSVGKGYTIAPKLLMLDGETNEVMSDLDLDYDIKKSKVTILKNTYGISILPPTIIPIENSNGIGISSIFYNSSTKDVTITLDTAFSDTTEFPIKVADKVLIENISVGVGSTGRGYNSDQYGYKLFTIISTNENLGGMGATVTYNLSEYFSTSDITPGVFDPENSIGRIIPQKHFPSFEIVLQNNEYIKGETVKSGDIIGKVDGWESDTSILRVSGTIGFGINDIIHGVTSKTQGKVSSIKSHDAYLTLSSNSDVIIGSESNKGFLNDNTQKLQDGDYYQNFSYSLKSNVPYEIWNDPVSVLNHTVGFKKFSDYQLESLPSNTSSLKVGLSTNQTYFNRINDLYEIVNLNNVYDFDLVKENYLNLNGKTVSTEVIFANKILNDYSESINNRVVIVDDVSSTFNSNPRSTKYVSSNVFNISEKTAVKYITLIKDRRYLQQRQFMIVDLIHDNSLGYTNQYGRVETNYDQGSFDFAISGNQGQLLFYPTNSSINDYDITTLSYTLDDTITGVGSTTIGSCKITNNYNTISGLTTTTIVSIGSTYSSAKILLQITPDINSSKEYEYTELNVIHNGSDIVLSQYGPLSTSTESHVVGLGTYSAYIDSSLLKIDFTPNANVGIGTTLSINSFVIGLGNTTFESNISNIDANNVRLESNTNSYNAVGFSSSYVVAEYPSDIYNAAYFIIQVADSTNYQYQLSEFIVVDDYIGDISTSQTYNTEYGNIETLSGIGTFGSRVVDNSGAKTQVIFTPSLDVDLHVNVYMNAIGNVMGENGILPFYDNSSLESQYAKYQGTDRDIKKSFDLTYKEESIFEKIFDASDTSIVNIDKNTIFIPNHFYVSGEAIKYYPAGTDSAIGITTTTFIGIGNTDKLPEDLFTIKVDANNIKLASTAQNALRSIPEQIDFANVGLGTNHKFVATNQNSKVLVSIDNVIQSPIVSTASTTNTSTNISDVDNRFTVENISSFTSGDLIKINDEIMLVDGISTDEENKIIVRRSRLGTISKSHSMGSLLTKVTGSYNIIDNILYFVEAPKGNIPIGLATNDPDERDWTGISTSSKFDVRIFLHSGISDTSNESYSKNYNYDDISDQFNSITNNFTLKSNGNNVVDISDENAIILINDVFQKPNNTSGITTIGSYSLNENLGITSLTFTGEPQVISNDVGISSFPKGGIIVSVGSSNGFGYQPLVSAGATAVVSIGGTIQSISIGNSGSGYRDVQTVNVGVKTNSSEIFNIGTANIDNGGIIGVNITNPGIGYTITNPPSVIIDHPISYNNIPLQFSNSSPSSGIGTGATIDIVVGQGSSIIDFTIKNTGYAYKLGEILTIPHSGNLGIPTTTNSFEEFSLTINEVYNDSFSGWSIGTLQILDNIESLFDGVRTTFELKYEGSTVSILAAEGSNINVQDLLLVFVNNILQKPGDSYKFTGGSIITFTEALEVNDKVSILFYKGTSDSDVVNREIIETVKIGDTLSIGYDPFIGQSPILQELDRTVSSIESTDFIKTIPYFGPGNTIDGSLLRPVILKRQTEDLIFNGKGIGKDREIYEPVINPVSYIINPVSSGSSILYVDNIRPIFDGRNENGVSLNFQKNITISNQGITQISAAATALVSSAGTITSLDLTNIGYGYLSPPTISIASTVGIDTTNRALATATIGIGGSVSDITITNPGVGYNQNNPPLVIISPPTITKETSKVSTYEGDNGIVVGFGTTTSSVIGMGTDGSSISVDVGIDVIFDLHIPYDSYLRDTALVGTAVTISSLSYGDYVIISHSNSIVGVETYKSIETTGGNIGISTGYTDFVFNINKTEIIPTNISGINTSIRRIYARITDDSFLERFSSNIITFDSSVPIGPLSVTIDSSEPVFSGGISTSNYIGNYSWGKVTLSSSITNEFNCYINNDLVGISTSDIIMRTSRIKFANYVS